MKDEDGEGEPSIGYSAPILDDDINEDMLENDIDDYDDTVNSFNIVSEQDDDTDVDLDQEEYTKEG